MQTVKKNLSDTKVQLTMAADAALLQDIKQRTLERLAADVKLQGFRAGKAPLSLVEKNVNAQTLQTEFLDNAMNRLYAAALDEYRLRPVAQPAVKITKFVPFDILEMEVEVEVVGDVKLPDYKKLKLPQPPVQVTAQDVNVVLQQVARREAVKKEVSRAAKAGDELTIDFAGTDAKTNEAIKGADGKDYPLALGSNTFIPGFEDNLIGMKAGQQKTFTLTFPKDYGVKVLQDRKVTFAVTAKKVQEVIAPKIDDALAAKVGPFKTVAELKADIKKQLQAEKQGQAERDYADKLITAITEKTKVAMPEALIDEQIARLEQDQRQNLLYRGQTWPEFLESEGLSEEAYRKQLRPQAELRAKAGLVLAEIAEQEKIMVTPQELDAQLQMLKSRYPDQQMQAELDKPETRRELVSRLVSEKTIAKLVQYATAAAAAK